MKAQSRLASRREEVKEEIVARASLAFAEHGVQGVTMDDIAHSLTMSKRTLYQFFTDKESLLLACIERHLKSDRERMEWFAAHTDNVLDLLLAIFAWKIEQMDGDPLCRGPIWVKYPRVVAFLEERRRYSESEAVNFLNQGKEQGYFRPSINFHIVYNQITVGMETLARNRLIERYSPREIFMNTVILYVRGCATLRGIEVIDRFMGKLYSDLGLGKGQGAGEK